MAGTETQTPLTIEQMRDNVLGILKNKFPDTPPKLTPNIPKDAEDSEFMLERHADRILKYCQSKDANNEVIVSFRNAGKATLDRINLGNPCKGHNILTKSLKEKSDSISGWTYQGSTSQVSQFDQFKGLVGEPVKDAEGNVTTNPPTLRGLYKYENGHPAVIELSAMAPGNYLEFYTGDYDMHDLIGFSNSKLLSGTPEEKAIIEELNYAMLPQVNVNNVDSNRRSTIDAYLKRVKTYPNSSLPNRNYNSAYALIRHGAQTSYVSRLLIGSDSIKINPFYTQLLKGDGITRIDPNILVFDKNGMYILNSIDKIYYYYAGKNLLQQIPFYYFFQYLIDSDTTIASEISGYSNRLYDLIKQNQARLQSVTPQQS